MCDLWDTVINPRSHKGYSKKDVLFVDEPWVRTVSSAPVRPLPASGKYMATTQLWWNTRMVHACPEIGYPLCYMHKKSRMMKGKCSEVDTEAEAYGRLGARFCQECYRKLDLISINRLRAAGVEVSMSWR